MLSQKQNTMYYTKTYDLDSETNSDSDSDTDTELSSDFEQEFCKQSNSKIISTNYIIYINKNQHILQIT